MSGAAGHIKHLHEDRSLTFGDLKDALTRAAQGKLERVTEKFDGLNLVFTWDFDAEDVRVARSMGDILNGGMGIDELKTKFVGRGSVAAAFEQAFQVLRQAIGSLSGTDRNRIFEPTFGRVFWYSTEVVYPSGANVINYDVNCVVFHDSPVYASNGTSVAPVATDDSGARLLSASIDRMQKALSMRGWRVMGPAMVRLQDATNGKALNAALEALDNVAKSMDMDDRNTIADYLQERAFREALRYVKPSVAEAISRRLVNEPGAPNVIKLVKMSPGHAQQIRNLVSRDKELIASFMLPIEAAISVFSNALLLSVSSMLIDDPSRESSRLGDELDAALAKIKASHDLGAMKKVNRQVVKMGGVPTVGPAIEGVVFVFKGQAYKFTGNWAPVHQILSIVRSMKGET